MTLCSSLLNTDMASLRCGFVHGFLVHNLEIHFTNTLSLGTLINLVTKSGLVSFILFVCFSIDLFNQQILHWESGDLSLGFRNLSHFLSHQIDLFW